MQQGNLCNKCLKIEFDFHRYLLAGLQWINSVLTNWPEELKASGLSGSAKPELDR